MNRLESADAPSSYGQKNYVYDEVGNIVEKDNKIYSYAEGGAGVHAVTSLSDGTTFTYDPNGNMFTKQESDGTLTQFTYDPENRLTKVVKDSATIAEYIYDGDGGRTTKIVNGITTTFVGSLYEETLAKGTKSVFLGSTRIASVVNGKVLYYHGDHLGGTNVVTDDVGDVSEIIEYMPFGKESRRDKFYADPVEQARYTFSNHYKDEETGLIFMQARYYDPSLGRFITADTIVQDPSNPVTLNRYHYAGNNPVNNIDPSGYGFFSKLFKAFKNSIGSFIGGVIGSTVGAFVGAIAGGLPGAIIGAYVGGTVGAGIGQTIQHGGSLGSNIKNAFIGSLPAVLGAGVGFAIGGPSGALAGAIGGGVAGSVVTTLANGGSLEDGVISGIVTTSYAVISLGYYKAIGSKVIQKGVDINNARRAGSQIPESARGNNPTKSLKKNNNPGPTKSTDARPIHVKRSGEFGSELRGTFASNGKYYPARTAVGGEVVYRQFGGASRLNGQSWSPVNPSTLGYNNSMGIPSGNTGAYIVKGYLRPGARYTSFPASSSGGRIGGGAEYGVLNPSRDIVIQTITPQ